MSTENTHDQPVDLTPLLFPTAKFPLGVCYITPGAQAALLEARQSPFEFLERHQDGDWGTVNTEDWQANDASLEDGSRIFSAYVTRLDVKLWVITEADRHATTLLLPEEY
jgi:hypothetical protein